MNELIVIEPTETLPTVPDNWDYDTSVEKTKTFIYKWKNLTDDIKEELWIAREMLSKPGVRTDLTSEQKFQGWDNYCKEIGTSRQVVNRWLEKAYATKKIPPPNQPACDENMETEHG